MLRGERVVLAPLREADLPAFYEAHVEIRTRGAYFPLGVVSESTVARPVRAARALGTRRGDPPDPRPRRARSSGHIEFFPPVGYWDAYELSYQLYDEALRGPRVHDRGRAAARGLPLRARRRSTASSSSSCPRTPRAGGSPRSAGSPTRGSCAARSSTTDATTTSPCSGCCATIRVPGTRPTAERDGCTAAAAPTCTTYAGRTFALSRKRFSGSTSGLQRPQPRQRRRRKRILRACSGPSIRLERQVEAGEAWGRDERVPKRHRVASGRSMPKAMTEKPASRWANAVASAGTSGDRAALWRGSGRRSACPLSRKRASAVATVFGRDGAQQRRAGRRLPLGPWCAPPGALSMSARVPRCAHDLLLHERRDHGERLQVVDDRLRVGRVDGDHRLRDPRAAHLPDDPCWSRPSSRNPAGVTARSAASVVSPLLGEEGRRCRSRRRRVVCAKPISPTGCVDHLERDRPKQPQVPAGAAHAPEQLGVLVAAFARTRSLFASTTSIDSNVIDRQAMLAPEENATARRREPADADAAVVARRDRPAVRLVERGRDLAPDVAPAPDAHEPAPSHPPRRCESNAPTSMTMPLWLVERPEMPWPAERMLSDTRPEPGPSRACPGSCRCTRARRVTCAGLVGRRTTGRRAPPRR